MGYGWIYGDPYFKNYLASYAKDNLISVEKKTYVKKLIKKGIQVHTKNRNQYSDKIDQFYKENKYPIDPHMFANLSLKNRISDCYWLRSSLPQDFINEVEFDSNKKDPVKCNFSNQINEVLFSPWSSIHGFRNHDTDKNLDFEGRKNIEHFVSQTKKFLNINPAAINPPFLVNDVPWYYMNAKQAQELADKTNFKWWR